MTPLCSTSPKAADIGQAVNDAMRAIEEENADLRGRPPQDLRPHRERTLVCPPASAFAGIPIDIEGDAFGKIYEYFLGKFAMSEGQKGGEFFTPPPSSSSSSRSSSRSTAGSTTPPAAPAACSSRAPSSSSGTSARAGRRALRLRPGEDRRDRPPLPR